MDDLKPCPFCGGKADATNYVIEASVVCQTCKATINREHGQHDDNGLPEAIAAWNVRADLLDAANARIAELEDKLGLERALSDGAHRRARNARAEALEEAAAKADDWTLTAEEVANGTGWPANVGENIGDAIRAKMGDNPND